MKKNKVIKMNCGNGGGCVTHEEILPVLKKVIHVDFGVKPKIKKAA